VLPQHLPGSFCRTFLPVAHRHLALSSQAFAFECFLLFAALGIPLALIWVD
jgi:hypothetical protein